MTGLSGTVKGKYETLKNDHEFAVDRLFMQLERI